VSVTRELERLRRLAAWESVFSSPDFSIGEWEGGSADADGVIQTPYFVYSEGVDRFQRELGQLGWVHPFDWPAWATTARGQELAGTRAAIATATPTELGNLLTTIVRSDRFSEGSLAGAFESGLILAIVRRAGELADQIANA
jgi:hypothetical protein